MGNKQELVREYLAGHGPATVAQVARELELTKAATANAMTNARIKGWVRKTGSMNRWEVVGQELAVIEPEAVLDLTEVEPLVTIQVYPDHARISLPDAASILKAVGG